MTGVARPVLDDALRAQIESLWERRDTLSPLTGGEDRLAIETVLDALDHGWVASYCVLAGWSAAVFQFDQIGGEL